MEGESSEQLANNDSQDFNATNYLIDEVLKDFQQRIQDWLSVHGKGPLSRQEYLLFENLPKCLPAEYKVVRSANGILDDVFTYNDFKESFYENIKAGNRELFAPISAKITSPTENIKEVLNEEELTKVENAICRPLLTETENYLDFYHDVVDRLNSDDLKEIYQKVKQFFARIGCDNFKSKDDEGIIPYCFWKDADEMVIPFAAGMVDAGYMEIEGLRNLPQFVNELRGNLYYLAYAYTIGSVRCSPENLNKNQQAFDRVYEDLLAYNDLEDPSWWEEFLRRAAANEIDELTEYFKDCRKVYEYKEKVGELIEIISTYDEIIEDVLAVYEGVETYLGVLEKGDTEGWYARGKLTLQVGTVFVGVGTITKITKVKTVINGLKQAIRSGSFSKFVDDLLKKSKGGVDELGTVGNEIIAALNLKYSEKIVNALKADFPDTKTLQRFLDGDLSVKTWKVLDDAGVDNILKRNPDFIKRFRDADIPDASLNHANKGDFTYDPKTQKPSRMKSGGHGQDNIDFLETNGFEYNIIKTYDNGVRIGNVPLHKNPLKRTGTGQSWFPKSWSAEDISDAGKYVSSLPENLNAVDGQIIKGTYKGVVVGVQKTNGKVGTIFADAVQ